MIINDGGNILYNFESPSDNSRFNKIEFIRTFDTLNEVIQKTLNGMVFNNVNEVRQGKFFEVEISETNKEISKTKVEEMCQKLLANLIIEDYKIIENINNS